MPPRHEGKPGAVPTKSLGARVRHAMVRDASKSFTCTRRIFSTPEKRSLASRSCKAAWPR